MNKHLSSEQLADLAEGLLPLQQREAARLHLVHCSLCREALARRQELASQLHCGLSLYLNHVAPSPALRWEKVRDQVLHSHKRSMIMWHRMHRVTASLLAVTMLVTLVWGLSILLRQMADSSETAAQDTPNLVSVVKETQETPTPTPFALIKVSESVEHLIQANTLILQAAWPQAPDNVPMYQVELLLQESSPDDVYQWAERLGMGPVRVYQPDGKEGVGNPASYVGINADWSMLRLENKSLGFGSSGFGFSMDNNFLSTISVDDNTARAAAQAFLGRLVHHLIVVQGATGESDVSFELTENLHSPGMGYRSYRVWLMLHGVFIAMESGMENTIIVGPEGQIHWAALVPLRLIPTGETATPHQPQAVLQDFVDGNSELMNALIMIHQDLIHPSQYFNRTRTYQQGETLVVDGYIELLRGVEDEADLNLLVVPFSSLPNIFMLEGVDAKNLSAYQSVRVQGSVQGMMSPDVWRLQVEQIGTPDSADEDGFMKRWRGQVRCRDGGLWLETDQGRTLFLPDPPDGLDDGTRVIVTGLLAHDDPDRLEWLVMEQVVTMRSMVTPTPIVSISMETIIYSDTVLPTSTPIPTLSSLPPPPVSAPLNPSPEIDDSQSTTVVAIPVEAPPEGWATATSTPIPPPPDQWATSTPIPPPPDRWDDQPTPPPQQIAVPVVPGPTELVITEIRLAYSVPVLFSDVLPPGVRAEPTKAKLLYLFIGHSLDGTYQATFYLYATEPMKVSTP